MPDDVSSGEIVRRLTNIERMLDTAYVQQRTYDADQRTQAERDRVHARRLERLESGQTWLMRSVIAAFGMIILAVAVQVIGALVSA